MTGQTVFVIGHRMQDGRHLDRRVAGMAEVVPPTAMILRQWKAWICTVTSVALLLARNRVRLAGHGNLGAHGLAAGSALGRMFDKAIVAAIEILALEQGPDAIGGRRLPELADCR